MFTLKYKDMRNQDFLVAIDKIDKSTQYATTKVAYDVGKMTKEVLEAMVLCQNDFVNALKKFSIVDADGNFVPKDDKPDTYQIIPEKLEAWQEAFEQFLCQTATIKRHKLDLAFLSQVGLSPKDIMALEPILLV